MRNENAICWATGDRCFGCPHLNGKAPHCSFRPPTILGRFSYWTLGRCSFRNVFFDTAENPQGIRVDAEGEER